MSTTHEVRVFSVHYVKLNMTCAYVGMDGGCDGDVSIIRTTQLTDGTLRIATMCDKHHRREKAAQIDAGFIMAGTSSIPGAITDAVLIDPSTREWMRERMRAHLIAEESKKG